VSEVMARDDADGWNLVNSLTDEGGCADDGHEPVWGTETKRLFDGIVAERKAWRRLQAHRLRPVSRVLLTGAPGTGKTTMAVKLSERLGMRLLRVRVDRLVVSRLGRTLDNIGTLFDTVREASYMAPMLLFLDEADALLSRRDEEDGDVAEMHRAVNVILQAMDSWNPRNLLVAATNLDGLIDPAAMRRFDLTAKLPPCDTDTARRVITRRLREIGMHLTDRDIRMLAEQADGLAPALIVRAIDRQARTAVISGTPIDVQAIANDLASDAAH
jgi:SpoVK/Ycf46/Vps4 family AAA+-type ATPase